MTARLLVLMGSGETTPTMVKVHRRIFDRLGADVDAVMLDTPFGFQENADDLCAKAIDYFRDAVGRTITVAGMRRSDAAPAEVAAAIARIRSADLVFAGPGSPTYALRQWSGTAVPDALADLLAHGGAVVFASAAALTVGLRTIPVYEVYKAGADPHWLQGLDLMTALGLPAVVIPHYDNAEGGHHDTRFCYLGETRLAGLEAELPDGSFVLGIDEHTAVIFDLDAATVEVTGRGGMTLRRAGASVRVEAGATVSMAYVASAGAGDAGETGGQAAPLGAPVEEAAADPAPAAASLGDEVRRLEAAFEAALSRRDVDTAVGLALELETAIVDWSTDAIQSDDANRAHAALRSMLVRLGEAAREGVRDPRAVLGPVVEAALALRAAVRSEKRFDLSDLVRDGLAGAGVEVRDTPDGQVWDLR